LAREGRGPEFIEALSRGLAVLRAFSADRPALTLSEVAQETALARPTARRILMTLEELGYVRAAGGQFALTPRVLELGMAYVGSMGLWDVARPHLEDLVAQTQESSSMSELDGCDIVYVARVAVPKLIALRVDIGTRFPAGRTSQGKVLLADLDPDEVDRRLSIPSRSGLPPTPVRSVEDLAEELARVAQQGYAVADEELAPGVRSVAVPVRDRSRRVRAAMNVTVHAAETSLEELLERHLPPLLQAANRVSEDWRLWQSRPIEVVRPEVAADPQAAGA
jgi:IclR family transcriptional regulator, pca regulon regulatory protein